MIKFWSYACHKTAYILFKNLTCRIDNPGLCSKCLTSGLETKILLSKLLTYDKTVRISTNQTVHKLPNWSSLSVISIGELRGAVKLSISYDVEWFLFVYYSCTPVMAGIHFYGNKISTVIIKRFRYCFLIMRFRDIFCCWIQRCWFN